MLYDAVATLADGDGGLTDLPPARDFVSDAFAHCKFIGHTSTAGLFDAGAALRYWDREASFVA